MWIWHEPGAIPNEPGAIFKIQVQCYQNITKVRTQRDQISLVFIMKTSKISPEGKFTANVRIYVT